MFEEILTIYCFNWKKESIVNNQNIILVKFILVCSQIEGYFDEDNKVIYLHLISAFDMKKLHQMCQKALHQTSPMVSDVIREHSNDK